MKGMVRKIMWVWVAWQIIALALIALVIWGKASGG
jgi:HAMP domain-containing protein